MEKKPIRKIKLWAGEIESYIETKDMLNNDLLYECPICKSKFIIDITDIAYMKKRGFIICPEDNEPLIMLEITADSGITFPLVYGLYNGKVGGKWCEPKMDESIYHDPKASTKWWDKENNDII